MLAVTERALKVLNLLYEIMLYYSHDYCTLKYIKYRLSCNNLMSNVDRNDYVKSLNFIAQT